MFENMCNILNIYNLHVNTQACSYLDTVTLATPKQRAKEEKKLRQLLSRHSNRSLKCVRTTVITKSQQTSHEVQIKLVYTGLFF